MKKIMLAAAIIIAGLQTIDAQPPQRDGRRMDPQEMVENRVNQMDKNLKLTDKQKEQIKGFMNESFKNHKPEKGKRPSEADRKAHMDALNTKIESVLTTDQKAKFQKMKEKEGKEMPPRGPQQ